MIATILFFALQGQSVAQEAAQFTSNLATSARGELALIDRLQSLRAATENLPQTWKSSVFKDTAGENRTLTKQGLLEEIEMMELSAAERWAIIVENTAVIDRSSTQIDERARAMRTKLAELPQLHLDLNQKLDAFNKRLKDGILLRLTSSLSQ